jgi:type II secretory pathway component HofQ
VVAQVDDDADADPPGGPPSRSILVTGPRTLGRGVPPSTRPRYSGRRIDLDVKSADIHEVCRLLADVGKVNIVVADEVRGTVTLRLRNVPWDQALSTILRVKGFRAERDGNIITVLAH